MSVDETYIYAYKNDPSPENLAKLVSNDLNAELILITWYVGHGYWYIPVIWDKLIDTHINSAGWYLLEEPMINNIPIRHSKVSSCISVGSSHVKILICYSREETSTINSSQEFAISAFLDKISNVDLLKRQKFRQELTLSNISHSIRTPLNGILHMTKAITEEGCTPDALQYLNQSTVALATNIFDIVDMTKLELGKLVLNKTVFNIRELINSTMSLARTLNKSAEVVLDCHIESDVPKYIYSDPKRIKQILINLLENALQHTQKGEIFIYLSSMIVNLASEDSELVLSDDYQYLITFNIRDTGPGMDEQTQENLFKPMEIITNSKQQGISLRISYLLAKALNGDLKLIEAKPHKGSSFELSIITCEEEPPVVFSQTLKTLKNKNILVYSEIDTDMIKVFERYSMKYTIANSEKEVTILHADKKFDLIIVQSEDKATFFRKIFKNTPLLGIAEQAGYDYHLYEYDDKSLKIKLIEIFTNVSVDTKQIKLLIVEDEQINRIVIEKLLRQAGFVNITMATGGEEALFIYSKNTNFDVLLIDIRMPLMSGFELADRIYKINPAAKMIGVTAQMVMEEETKPWFNNFVYKPIDSAELVKKIKQVVR